VPPDKNLTEQPVLLCRAIFYHRKRILPIFQRSGALIFGVLIFGALIFGVLIFGVLIFGVPNLLGASYASTFGALIFGALIFGVLIFGVPNLLGASYASIFGALTSLGGWLRKGWLDRRAGFL
jgi:hypothetical protein